MIQLDSFDLLETLNHSFQDDLTFDQSIEDPFIMISIIACAAEAPELGEMFYIEQAMLAMLEVPIVKDFMSDG